MVSVGFLISHGCSNKHTQCIFVKSCLSFFNRDTSGQGRFCTIFRSYSRGAQVRPVRETLIFVIILVCDDIFYFFFLQGILLVYDITNEWSFDGIDRWIREIDEVIPCNTFGAGGTK